MLSLRGKLRFSTWHMFTWESFKPLDARTILQNHEPVNVKHGKIMFTVCSLCILTIVILFISHFGLEHHANMSVYCIPPYTPLLYSKSGVLQGFTLFSYFCSKT